MASEADLTLYTFGPSHYCEKARWALDLSCVAYREVRWAPGPHVIAARRIAPGSSLPILDGADGVIQGSCSIIDWLEAMGRAPWHHATASAERDDIAALTARANRLGDAIRRLVYATGLSTQPTRLAQQLFAGTSLGQRSAAWPMWPVTRQLIMRGLRATASDIPHARACVEQELDALDAILSDGRRYLLGGRLTRADIATASLLSPIAMPAHHPVYRDTVRWDALQQTVVAYRDRRCVNWATHLYEHHREPAVDLAPSEIRAS